MYITDSLKGPTCCSCYLRLYHSLSLQPHVTYHIWNIKLKTVVRVKISSLKQEKMCLDLFLSIKKKKLLSCHHTYISIFTDEAENHVYADESSGSANPCTAVRDDGSWLVDVPHVGYERQQLLRLRGRTVVWPTGVVQVGDALNFFSLEPEG